MENVNILKNSRFKYFEALQEKAKNIKWNNNNREEYFILFSKSGFSEELEELAQKEKNIILKKLI